MDSKKLNDKELEQVVGGKQDKDDYVYEAVASTATPFFKAISSTPENYKVWFELAPGVTEIRVREENLVDWHGDVYVRCIAKVDQIEEGYVLQKYVVKKAVK